LYASPRNLKNNGDVAHDCQVGSHIVMANGMTMNVLDQQKMRPPAR
jgi:hypothetical protein